MILILFFLILWGFFYLYLTKNYNYWEKRGIAGPKPKLFVGTFPSIFNKKKLLKDEVAQIYKQYKGKESVVGTYLGTIKSLMILDPMIAKSIMTTNFKYFHDHGKLFGDINKDSDPIAGRDPFFLKGKEWKETRNEISPAFSNSRIKSLFPIMNSVCQQMKKYIKDTMAVSDHIETRELCAKYTTDVVCNAIYGVESGAFSQKKSELREIARNMFKPSVRLFIVFILHPIFPFISKLLKIRFISDKTASVLMGLLNTVLQYRKENNIQRQDFLDYLTKLKEKKGISDIEVAAHTITFFVDGVETSSLSLSFLFYELAKNKYVQDKLRQEMLNIRNSDGTFDYDAIMENQFLDQILIESLRMNTLAPQLSRECTEDFELKLPNNKVLIVEKGINVTFPVFDIFHDPEYYGPSANTFDPERFNEKNCDIKTYKEKGVLYAFGDGPRNCLGQKYAKAQIKCCVAHIVTSFEISLSEKMPLKPEYSTFDIMLCFKSGILLKYTPIDE